MKKQFKICYVLNSFFHFLHSFVCFDRLSPWWSIARPTAVFIVFSSYNYCFFVYFSKSFLSNHCPFSHIHVHSKSLMFRQTQNHTRTSFATHVRNANTTALTVSSRMIKNHPSFPIQKPIRTKVFWKHIELLIGEMCSQTFPLFPFWATVVKLTLIDALPTWSNLNNKKSTLKFDLSIFSPCRVVYRHFWKKFISNQSFWSVVIIQIAFDR